MKNKSYISQAHPSPQSIGEAAFRGFNSPHEWAAISPQSQGYWHEVARGMVEPLVDLFSLSETGLTADCLEPEIRLNNLVVEGTPESLIQEPLVVKGRVGSHEIFAECGYLSVSPSGHWESISEERKLPWVKAAANVTRMVYSWFLQVCNRENRTTHMRSDIELIFLVGSISALPVKMAGDDFQPSTNARKLLGISEAVGGVDGRGETFEALDTGPMYHALDVWAYGGPEEHDEAIGELG